MTKKCWIRRPRQNKSRPLTPNEAEAARQAATLSPEQLAALTPRQRLDSIHAMQAHLDYQTRRGELVELREVEAAHAEMREVIKSDLLGALPLRLVALLSGRTPSAYEIRSAALKAVNEMLRRWHKASIPTPEIKAESPKGGAQQ